jgi:tetratricopeptide (TPR) repeat protein
MAKIPLRTYIKDIETLIERGNTDEAIAHCRHILKTFPKFLDAYRMLGKAYLEAHHYNEAADVFKRVLMAAPDDFVSHVGLSIINDEQKKLEDTIWHMERAFETQPSNAAIQSELQRLYGRRDGMEPHKIRLTRGALAHMYVQGELYPQAIGEIRSVLSDDENRADMQALLALAYFRNGQKVEATEACSRLLSRAPFCLNANRILVEILPGTGMADSVPTYRGRVVELDPYASYSPGSIFQSEEVADNAVMIERLEFKGHAVEPLLDWKDSLGLPAGTSPSAMAAQPDWLRDAMGPQAGAPAPAEESIPDFLRDAGWAESTGAFDESAQVLETPAQPSESIEKGELPDWVKAMAPTVATEPEPTSTDSDDDWLSKLGEPVAPPASAAGQPDWLASMGEPKYPPAQPAEKGELPDWLSSLGESPSEPAPSTPVAGESDWLSSLGEPAGAAAVPNTAADLPDWLSSLDQPSAPAESIESEPAKVEPMRDSSSEPSKYEPTAPQPAGLGPSIGDLGTSAADQDAAMAWLESLAAKQGAKAEELITNPNERVDTPPEWVEQAKTTVETSLAEPVREEPTAAPAWPLPEDRGRFASVEEVSSTDQTSAWLRNLEAEEEKPQESLWSGEIEVTPPVTDSLAEPAVEADLPSWLRGLDQEPARQPASEDLPSWLKEEEARMEEEGLPEPTRPSDWMPEIPKVAEPVKPESPRVVEPPKAAKPAPAVPVSPPAPMPVAAPSRAEEPVPSPKPPKPAPRKKSEMPAVDRAKLKRTGMLPPMVDPALAGARDHMEHARVPDALHAYEALIRKGKFLEEVTFDLKEALYRFPVEVSIWQTLGDAYMRANRLQDALDAYTKAEELLR